MSTANPLRELWELHRTASENNLRSHIDTGLTHVSLYVERTRETPTAAWLSVWWTPDGTLLRCLRTERTPTRTERLYVPEALSWLAEGMPLKGAPT